MSEVTPIELLAPSRQPEEVVEFLTLPASEILLRREAEMPGVR